VTVATHVADEIVEDTLMVAFLLTELILGTANEQRANRTRGV
jgi:hypothetical protein